MTPDPKPSDATMFFGPRVNKSKHQRQAKTCIVLGMFFLVIAFVSNIWEVYFQAKITALNSKNEWDASTQLWYRTSAGFAAFGLWMAVLMLFQAVIQLRKSLLLSDSEK